MCGFSTFVKNQLSVAVWVCCCTVLSIPLVYVSIFTPIPCCFDDDSFVGFEARECNASYFVLFTSAS
jgi:hypothetical protein